MKAEKWVKKLGLEKHPEGGYFRETFRSEIKVSVGGFPRTKSASTAIYYMLKSGQFSAFHRIKSDEMWHFYAGSPLVLHVIDKGTLQTMMLGRDKGQQLQGVIRAGLWFAASVAKSRSYSLVGCTVSPGFDFADWEMASRKELMDQYPRYRRTIEKYTR